jgi:hypothetical protein
MLKSFPEPRFSGHESFVLRAGWLRKFYDAVTLTPEALESDESSILRLGIGRNMVKSLEFWADACSVAGTSDNGLAGGTLGHYFFHPDRGVDPYMETIDSIAMVHWAFSVNANIAAWDIIFANRTHNRFTRSQLVEQILKRARTLKRPLSPNTADQHASIFLASYNSSGQEDEQSVDAVACPLQDLEMVRRSVSLGKDDLFETRAQDRLRLLPSTMARILAQYWTLFHADKESLPFETVLNGYRSPGAVFRLTDFALERAISAIEVELPGVFRLVDTVDTRRITVSSIEALNKWAVL